MRYVHYQHNNACGYGVILEEDASLIYQLPLTVPPTDSLHPWTHYDTVFPYLLQTSTEEITQDVKKLGKTVAVSEVIFTAPIPVPRHDVVCVGLNYKDHVTECHKELDFVAPAEPTYFCKRATQIYTHGDLQNWDSVDTKVDYEVELAVIIGKSGKNIKPEEVRGYILGYAVFNDYSARTVQKSTSQWYRGKSLDGLCAMSSSIVLAKDLTYPLDLPIKSYINGELRQSSTTNNLIHSVDYLISQFSTGCTLEAGDIFITGTPAGVGMGMDPPQYLKVGDTVKCEIEGIGTLTHNIV